MNILPNIRNTKKKSNFANPLSGLVYSNNQFLKGCQYESEPDQQIKPQRNKQSKSTHRKGIFSQSFYQPKQTHNKDSKNTHNEKIDPQIHHYMSMTQQFLNQTKDKYHKQKLSHNRIYLNNNSIESILVKKKKKGSNQFPDICVKILDLINTHRDLRFPKQLKVNFSHYYSVLFHQNLAGNITKEFLQLVEKYMEKLVKQNGLDKKIDPRDYPADIFKIKSKRMFVQKAKQYENYDEILNIQAMIQQYCVPSLKFRQSCFKDIVFMLSRSLYQKFNMNKQNEYVLLDCDGRLIKDLCDIKFSTKLLFITQKQNYNKMYQRYVFILDDNQQTLNKISFSDGLKKKFRETIALGKIEQPNSNKLEENGKSPQKRLQMAENTIMMKSNNLIKKVKRQTPSPPKTSTSFSNYKASGISGRQIIRPKTNLSYHHHRHSEGLSSPKVLEQQKQALRFQSSTPYLSLLRTTLNEQIQTKKRMLRYKQQFAYLINQNSHYSITFNHENDNKVLVKTLKKFSPLLKNKGQLQINKILEALQILYENNKSIQNKLIINKKQQRIERLWVEWEDFVNLKEVSTCKGNKDHIIDFVNRYVEWNQFGEIDRKQLGRTVQFASGDTYRSSIQTNTKKDDKNKEKLLDKQSDYNNLTKQNKEVIEEVIWSWLEKNKLVENDVLSKNKLQSWYQQNKLAYVLLISLIFGTNIVSVLDMAFEVIAQD